MVRPIRRTDLVTQVIDVLHGQIDSGAWPVGAKIPTEPELAKMTGTGRNTVREAVQALVHAGMLDRRQGAGTFVLAAAPADDSMRARFGSARDRDLLELRGALEITAAALAARRRSPSQVARLRGLLAEIARHRAADDPDTAAEADAVLHETIVEATDNALFAEMYRTLAPRLRADITAESRRTGHVHDAAHVRLVDAIERCDHAAAEECARALVERRLDELG